jgi:hypothetical protein
MFGIASVVRQKFCDCRERLKLKHPTPLSRERASNIENRCKTRVGFGETMQAEFLGS